MRPDAALLDPDERLLRRRDCEYEIFQSVEEAVELPRIKEGFGNIKDFLSLAQSILQRRKARSGLSLELQTREIFTEEELREGEQFSYAAESEPRRRPDFLFPSQARYQDPAHPPNQLRMLAVKDHLPGSLAPDSQRGGQNHDKTPPDTPGRRLGETVSGNEGLRRSAGRSGRSKKLLPRRCSA